MRRCVTWNCIGAALALLFVMTWGTAAPAAELAAPAVFAAPDGKATNAGTVDAPWDIASALDGSKKIEPGTTVYLRAGIYKRRPQELFEVKLVGTEEKPIHIRPYPGERATIDGGLIIKDPSAYVWVWDLEIMVSEPNQVEAVESGSHPRYNRPSGGLASGNAALDCKNCKFINLVIHHTRQGISWWVGALDCEIYGCLVYDNGWLGTDRGHGHAMYVQNKEGHTTTIADCIMTQGYSYSIHAYGSDKAYADNFDLEGNVCYNAGDFLVGTGRPSHNCVVRDNYLYNCHHMRLGYAKTPKHENGKIQGNVIGRGDLWVWNYQTGEVKNNTIIGGVLDIADWNKKGEQWVQDPKPAGLVVESNTVVPAENIAKQENLVVLRPNKYDPNRANLIIYNWKRDLVVFIDASKFLKDGDAYVLKDPEHFFDDPVHWGYCEKGKISVPMYFAEFKAFVMLKGAPGPAASEK